LTQQRYSNHSSFNLTERNSYGSSRLGRNSTIVDVYQTPPSSSIPYIAGKRYYELSNHLGNVLAVINDIKYPVEDNGYVDYFEAHLVSISDYSPFGVQLDERTVSSSEYRYGFQGQEKDDEIKGEGNSVNYTFRMHDPRVGRFLSVDPLASQFAWNSPYSFSENQVTWAVELEGLEKYIIHQRSFAPWPKFGKMEMLPDTVGNRWYHGDNRGFSLSSNVTSRINSQFTVDISTGSLIGKPLKWSDETISYDDFGNKISSVTEEPSFMVANPSKSGMSVRTKTYFSGSNPLIPAILPSPPIQWDSDITILDNIANGNISVSYNVIGKGFPAYEAFIEDEKGTKVFLAFQSAPKKQKFLERLSGAPYQQGSTFSLILDTDKDGNFTGGMQVLLPDEKGKSIWVKTTIEDWNLGIENATKAAPDQGQ
jgi:RHS repeat-associated protein